MTFTTSNGLQQHFTFKSHMSSNILMVFSFPPTDILLSLGLYFAFAFQSDLEHAFSVLQCQNRVLLLITLLGRLLC